MIKKVIYVGTLGAIVAVVGVLTLQYKLPVGPIVLGLTVVPVAGLLLARRSLKSAVPDLVFGAIDTGLLAVLAVWGGVTFGVAGAIAGGVAGDAVTDGIAGLFEGGIAKWLRGKGIDESREPVTTALGKMAGCLFGSGLAVTLALLFGVQVRTT
jgi:hypothetical protein